MHTCKLLMSLILYLFLSLMPSAGQIHQHQYALNWKIARAQRSSTLTSHHSDQPIASRRALLSTNGSAVLFIDFISACGWLCFASLPVEIGWGLFRTQQVRFLIAWQQYSKWFDFWSEWSAQFFLRGSTWLIFLLGTYLPTFALHRPCIN